jgi:hypothetical protein
VHFNRKSGSFIKSTFEVFNFKGDLDMNIFASRLLQQKGVERAGLPVH